MPRPSEAHQKVLFKPGNTRRLSHGMRSAILKAPLERKYRARIFEAILDEDSDPREIDKLAESFAIVTLGTAWIRDHGRESLSPKMQWYYDRHVRRRDKLCRLLGIPVPGMQPKPRPTVTDYAPDPPPREAYPDLPEPKPPPSPNPTGMPRYLREAQTDRLQVIQQLEGMTQDERLDELRIPRIYESSGMPQYLREAMREGRL